LDYVNLALNKKKKGMVSMQIDTSRIRKWIEIYSTIFSKEELAEKLLKKLEEYEEEEDNKQSEYYDKEVKNAVR